MARLRSFLTVAFLLLAVVVLVFGFYKQYYVHHLSLPVGCDEFGYLNLARAIGQGRPFLTPTPRPFDPQLIPALLSSRFKSAAYMFLICPHAYHFHPAAKKVVNQYPPGTSLLLSALPGPARQRLAPPAFALFIILFLILAAALEEKKISFFGVGLTIFVMGGLFFLEPFRGAFTAVNSLAPTFGLLIGAGYLLDKRPGVSLLFLGLTVIFRVVNAWLVLPFLIIYVCRKPSSRLFSLKTLGEGLKGGTLFLAGGPWIYFLFVWILLGNPFRSTYSFLDLAPATLKSFGPNIPFYFNLRAPWFLAQVALLVLLVLMTLVWKTPWKWVAFSWGLAAWNYLYFLSHNVRVAYYPYAPALVLLGVALYQLAVKARPAKMGWIVPVIGLTFILLLWRSTSHKFPWHGPGQLYASKVKPYTDCFSGDDVVWAGERSGTVEYAIRRAGFRYTWGLDHVKARIMHWLRGYGYRQAVWVSDIELSREQVEATLKSFRLPYRVKVHPELGTYLEILPQDPAD